MQQFASFVVAIMDDAGGMALVTAGLIMDVHDSVGVEQDAFAVFVCTDTGLDLCGNLWLLVIGWIGGMVHVISLGLDNGITVSAHVVEQPDHIGVVEQFVDVANNDIVGFAT